jgi:flagellar hook-associated protein 2
MAGLIAVGGLATGLDTNRIISQLVQLERRPITLLEREISSLQATKASVATVSGKLGALRTAAQALASVGGVLVRKAASSDEAVLGATAGSGAARGATTITVTQLARASVAGATAGVAAATSTVATGAGTFEFRVGAGAVQSVAVEASTTLAGLADAINALGAGVTASAVNLGTASSPDWRLQLVTDTTGAAQTLTIVQDGTTLGVQTSQAGLDAQFTVAGFAGTFARETNTFGDVLTGVTITLKSTGTSTITVEDDGDTIVEQVQALVTAYNDVVTFVRGESTVEPSSDRDELELGTLATNTTVRRLLARIQEIVSAPVAGATTQYVNLSSVGIATQRDGTLTFDEAAFRTALGANPTAVAQVFAGNGTGTGVAADLVAFLRDATGTGGTISTHTTSLDDRIRALQEQIDAGQRRLDAFEADLVARFTALETLVGRLQSQSGFLASSL